MASNAASTAPPVLRRARNFQWYWNSSFDNSEQWEKYTDIENEVIEDACNEGLFDVEIDGDYVINLEFLLQYKKHDEFNTVCSIKRVQLNRDRNQGLKREERFTLPVTDAAASTSSNTRPRLNDDDILNSGVLDLFPQAYFIRELLEKDKTMSDVVDDAAQGIIIEGATLLKSHEAKWLAEQLRTVKHYGSGIKANDVFSGNAVPSQIGQTCVHIYTKESFWYKLINKVLRDRVNWEKVKTLGPFCYLLWGYLKRNFDTPETRTVYRSLDLTDEQRQIFMRKRWICTSFTSCTTNRQVAEFYDGNTLLIMDLNEIWGRDGKVIVGANISSISDFPSEEEFLVRPGTIFYFDKYEYDNVNKKHIIYLKSCHVNF